MNFLNGVTGYLDWNNSKTRLMKWVRMADKAGLSAKHILNTLTTPGIAIYACIGSNNRRGP